MKKALMLVVAALMLCGGNVSMAHESNSIPVTGYWDETQNPKNVERGSPCEVVGPLGFSRQIVVRDEADVIIAVWSVHGTWEELEGRDFLGCSWSYTIPVPEAAFYTLYLDEQRLITLDESSAQIGIALVIPALPDD